MRNSRSPLLSKCEIAVGLFIAVILALIFVTSRASAHVMACTGPHSTSITDQNQTLTVEDLSNAERQ